jgi:hypothetical protein
MSQRTWYLVTVIAAFLIAAAFLGAASRCDGFGFPLDDGWIHQTYARNLAQTGRLAYVMDELSTGSTSPLWTLLLSLGYLLPVPPFLWTYVLGGACWLAVAWASEVLTRRLFPHQRAVARWVGLACLLEWHLVWAAFSGMETMLFTFLSLFLIERYAAGAHPFALGVIGGLLLLTRPEGIVLVGLTIAVVIADQLRRSQSRRLLARGGLLSVLIDLAAGLAVLLIPYVIFNQVVSGQPLPNTFYAKQAEYRALLAQPIWTRLWVVVRRTLVGPQVLLIPGFVWQAVQVVRRGTRERPSRALSVLPVVWWAAYLTMYALLLPVDYQHGRYLVPTIPTLLVYGITGTALWLRPRSAQMGARVLSRAVVLTVCCLFAAFLVIGWRAYADDVCVINGEMVEVARWIEANTPPDALVAAHDIGAIGYYGRRPLLDLAGLVTPDVIPFIRDEPQLLEFVLSREADYLVTFPSWYPEIVADARLRMEYQTQCQLTREKGSDNMAVYRIER